MISFREPLFLTEKAGKKLDKIKSDIEKRKYLSLACVIAFSANETDVFDIIPVSTLRFLDKTDNVIVVIGVAESKKAAVNLCARLSATYVAANSMLSMREYFEQLI